MKLVVKIESVTPVIQRRTEVQKADSQEHWTRPIGGIIPEKDDVCELLI